MVTYTVDIGLNKIMVTEVTLKSMVGILAAAGHSESEIAALLRRAADQLENGAEPLVADDSEWNASINDTAGADTYELFQRYEQTSEKRALARLSKRASALGYAQDDETLAKAFEIVSQALPLVAVAQKWIMDECAALGIQFETSKDEWLETASDAELDREEEIVFLDDWQVSNDFQLQQIDVLARAYAHSGNIEGYKRLVALLGQHRVLYGSKILEEVEKAGEAFESMAGFMEFLAEHAGEGELTQSTLLDDYVLRSQFRGGNHMLEGWLEALAAEGKIQRYKRSNRWRLVI